MREDEGKVEKRWVKKDEEKGEKKRRKGKKREEKRRKEKKREEKRRKEKKREERLRAAVVSLKFPLYNYPCREVFCLLRQPKIRWRPRVLTSK